MTSKYIRLYNQNTEPDCAFFLEEGRVFFYPNTADKYAINGHGLIFGATEIIMESMAHMPALRIETAVTGEESRIKRMSLDKFRAGMETYSFLLNVSMVLAQQVLLTNQIINKNLNELAGDEKKTRELSMEYFTIIERMRKEYDKRRLPWIADILKEFELNLTCKRGEAYYRSAEPVKITKIQSLSDKMVEYSRGSVICEENSQGEEMYILQSGAIDVFIGGNCVATIEEPGTVSGEMALLLGQKRTATLKAKNSVVLTRITKKDLKEVAQKESSILQAIALSLAKRHYYNVIKIADITEKTVNHQLDGEAAAHKKVSQSQQAMKDLAALKNRVQDAVYEKKADFLKDISELQ